MGHYDNCRDGYCARCGAAPGNLSSNGGVCPFCHPETRMDQSIRAIKYRHTPDMGVISREEGIESACQDMLEAGVKWIDEQKVARSERELKNFASVAFPGHRPVFGLERTVAEAAPHVDFGTRQLVLLRLFMVAQFGWDKYCEEMRRIHAEGD